MKKLNIFSRYLKSQFIARREEDEMITYHEIQEGSIFKGFNLWILGFAMIIACIGLITDSVSAVIGAMLISPLMGPIIGMAFAIAINDKMLQRQSLKNWILMTLVSLLSATMFFLINPFHSSTSMLEAFKKASIFDIGLAFFGGMAGFIGIVKKEGIKIIAGVAVATACMPPLCTAAYGIANGDLNFFIGGFYFYIINCLFIGWATFLLTRYFKFKAKLPGGKRKFHIFLWNLLIVIMLVPGIYIAYLKWKAQETAGTILSDKQRIELLEKKIDHLDAIIQHSIK